MTIHTRQLQQYTLPTNNNYTRDKFYVNLFIGNSPYYHLLKYLLFLLKHTHTHIYIYICIYMMTLRRNLLRVYSGLMFRRFSVNAAAHLLLICNVLRKGKMKGKLSVCKPKKQITMRRGVSPPVLVHGTVWR